jgi:hypothetical protein
MGDLVSKVIRHINQTLAALRVASHHSKNGVQLRMCLRCASLSQNRPWSDICFWRSQSPHIINVLWRCRPPLASSSYVALKDLVGFRKLRILKTALPQRSLYHHTSNSLKRKVISIVTWCVLLSEPRIPPPLAMEGPE